MKLERRTQNVETPTSTFCVAANTHEVPCPRAWVPRPTPWCDCTTPWCDCTTPWCDCTTPWCDCATPWCDCTTPWYECTTPWCDCTTPWCDCTTPWCDCTTAWGGVPRPGAAPHGLGHGTTAGFLWRRLAFLVTRGRRMLSDVMDPKQIVFSDPEILGGTPVFVGMRVPVDALIDFLEGGDTIEDFLGSYPG